MASSSTAAPSHGRQRGIIAQQWHTIPALPIDYTFKDLTKLNDLAEDEPRSGKTKRMLAQIEPVDPLDQIERTLSIRLAYNKLTNLAGFQKAINDVLKEPEALNFVDLSFNDLTNIDEVLTEFKQLGILYLHANKITSLAEVDKLAQLPNLRTLTLHGNPVENVKGYRHYVISKLPQLRHLDFTGITIHDRSVAETVRARKAAQDERKRRMASENS